MAEETITLTPRAEQYLQVLAALDRGALVLTGVYIVHRSRRSATVEA